MTKPAPTLTPDLVPEAIATADDATAADLASVPGHGRDHALSLQRFVGGLQIFGGFTLSLGYALGADGLDLDVAATALVLLGLLQIALGVAVTARPALLRAALLRRPGTLVAFGLAATAAVIALGGSGSDRVYITSADCWLILTGLALPGLRWIPAVAVVAALVIPIWAVFDADAAGFLEDGVLTTAVIALVGSVSAGLWMGRVTGRAIATLNRWVVIELHELGVVDQLRNGLADVRAAADRLQGVIRTQGDDVATEVRLLRERLAGDRTLTPDEDGELTSLETMLRRVEEERAGQVPLLRLTIPDGAGDLLLNDPVADALQSVVRRQLDNIVRHAPNAKVAELRVETFRDQVHIRIEDDGGGALPFRAGQGTGWSARQLGRVGGGVRYYAGDRGVGFELRVPARAAVRATDVEGLSVQREVRRFGLGFLDAVRFAGYVGDTVTASAAAGSVGHAWLVVPVGAVLIEATIRAGRAGVGGLSAAHGAVAASVITAAVTALAILPDGRPPEMLPATTAVLVPALVLYFVGRRAWYLAEGLRLLVALPLLVADPVGWLGFLVVYPLGFYVMVGLMVRFTRRASGLEQRVANAFGRAGLSSAVIGGLSLRHDAIDVVSRADVEPAVRDAVVELEQALTTLDRVARGNLDPRAVVAAGLSATLGGRLAPPTLTPEHDRGRSIAGGAVDRITLFEVAALAADERASCAPPGMLGRRRLVRVEPTWSASDRGGLVLDLVARPTVGAPDPVVTERLRFVAESLGIEVHSTRERLTLSYDRA